MRMNHSGQIIYPGAQIKQGGCLGNQVGSIRSDDMNPQNFPIRALAASINILEGMQPAKRQVPPNFPIFSKRYTVFPWEARNMAAGTPPGSGRSGV